MTDFVAETRHYCRNPRCRSKLPAPVASAREAFCVRGCFNSFYLHRCLVCEGAIEQPKRGRRLICKRAKCRNALQGGLSLGRYHHAQSAKLISESADSIGVKEPAKADIQPWRIVAGPEPSPSSFHCAVVGATEAAINRTNARHWREHNAKAEERCSIKHHHPPVNVVGGYRFPGAPSIDLSQSPQRQTPSCNRRRPQDMPTCGHGDGLDIPEFLLRRPQAA
jgi:hypothetical protein